MSHLQKITRRGLFPQQLTCKTSFQFDMKSIINDLNEFKVGDSVYSDKFDVGNVPTQVVIYPKGIYKFIYTSSTKYLIFFFYI